MNLRKGISPVIATVIIVAVALAIAIAAVGWVMGIWGSVTGGTELLKILPDSKIIIYSNNVTVKLHVRNEGGATATIDKIVVGTTDFTVKSGNNTISAGETAWVFASYSDTSGFTAGAAYTVKIYTVAGNVYTTQIVAESG